MNTTPLTTWVLPLCMGVMLHQEYQGAGDCTEIGSPLSTIMILPNVKLRPDDPVPWCGPPSRNVEDTGSVTSTNSTTSSSLLIWNTALTDPANWPCRTRRWGHLLSYPVFYCSTILNSHSSPAQSVARTACLQILPQPWPWHPSSPGCLKLCKSKVFVAYFFLALITPPIKCQSSKYWSWTLYRRRNKKVEWKGTKSSSTYWTCIYTCTHTHTHTHTHTCLYKAQSTEGI